jgi:hypothetical protein
VDVFVDAAICDADGIDGGRSHAAKNCTLNRLRLEVPLSETAGAAKD